VSWSVILSRNAVKDVEKLGKAGLKSRVEHLLKLLKENPFEKYPRYEKLVGNLEGYYSRRINIQHIQHRLVYSVDEENKVVHILRMWSHYE